MRESAVNASNRVAGCAGLSPCSLQGAQQQFSVLVALSNDVAFNVGAGI